MDPFLDCSIRSAPFDNTELSFLDSNLHQRRSSNMADALGRFGKRLFHLAGNQGIDEARPRDQIVLATIQSSSSMANSSTGIPEARESRSAGLSVIISPRLIQ